MGFRQLRRSILWCGVLAFAGCAARARAPELVAFEKLRNTPTLSDDDRRAFDLLAAADDLFVRVEGEWERNDSASVRRDALMGQIKVKTALAILEAQHQRERIANLDAALVLARDEQSRLEEELETAREELALLERFKAAKHSAEEERKTFSAEIENTRKQAAIERQRLAEQLAAEKLREKALEGLRDADLALRAAETVDAPRFAKAKFVAANAMLQNAHKAWDAGRWEEVVERSASGRAEAEAGASLARPQYEKATEALNVRARDRALEAEATALPDLTARLERDGELQRLALIPKEVFADGQGVLLPSGAKVLDAIDGLLAKYPTYTVQITGFGDDAAKPTDRGGLALARANAVFWALVNRGIDARRLRIDAPSAANAPSSQTASTDAFTRHARVELVILYHIVD
ncbi:MAG TPA: OmpA family protein [Polyangia bacterium]|nr:OmpA family protein [Polyangia bacterium]